MQLLLIPSTAVLWRYPSWKALVGIGAVLTILQSVMNILRFIPQAPVDLSGLVLGSVVDWSVLAMVVHFGRMHTMALRTVERMAWTDALTGLPNRRFFDAHLEKALTRSQQSQRPLLLMMIDVDHFKRVNDTQGHLCGDQALRHLAQVLRHNIRESDTLVRLGGEEFAVVLPDTSIADGALIAERICAAVAQSEFMYEAERVCLTVSAGLASCDGRPADDFVRRSDHALYQAKAKGRNRLVVLA